jgi:hypothetical protein
MSESSAQHEAEVLKAKLVRLRRLAIDDLPGSLNSYVSAACSIDDWSSAVDSALCKVLVSALQDIGDDDFCVRTTFHGNSAWRDGFVHICEPLDDLRDQFNAYTDVGNAKDAQISLELLVAAAIEIYRRMYPGQELVDYALGLVGDGEAG